MTKIYRSLINGAPFILAMALGLSFMDTHINYWKSAFISLALLLVKESATIFLGSTCKSSIIRMIRFVMTLVFPDPAPANIRSGPFVEFTASICSLFKSKCYTLET